MILAFPLAIAFARDCRTVPVEALTAKNAVEMMSPGINLGNTMEAIPNEGSWGNPEPDQTYFDGVREAGFRSVRLPVAWSQYADAASTISPSWMKHVTEVVRMARKADLYILINIHWDGGWIQAVPSKKDTVTKKLRIFWQQIATNFRDFDDHLLFAGTNEIGVDGQYGIPARENGAVQNSYNQAFVETVRATGHRNVNRFLVVQAYNTDIDVAMKVNTVMPRDAATDRLMMEVHYYSPYNFVLNDKSDVWQWGKTATDPKATDSWGNEDYVDAEFAKMEAAFVEKGVPVILGEYSAGLKARFPGMNPFRLLWDQYVTGSAIRHGMVPMLWDTGSAFDRRSGEPKDSELIRLILEAVKSTK